MITNIDSNMNIEGTMDRNYEHCTFFYYCYDMITI